MTHFEGSSSTRNSSTLGRDFIKLTHNDHLSKRNDSQDIFSNNKREYGLKEVQPFRSYRKDMPYLSGLANSAQTTKNEPRKIIPCIPEDKLYKEKYYDSLNQKAGFRKKEGYFTEFASRNKILTDEYKALKQPENGHSRYISKPVIFTTLKSKNKLSQLVGLDHSQLLEERKNFSFKDSILIGGNSPKKRSSN